MPLHHSPIAADDMPPAPSTPEIEARETVIILDWDDTLLCSSFLAAHDVRLDSHLPDASLPVDASASAADRQAREVSQQIRELETCVYQLIQNSIQGADRTIIITNAEYGWVELSAAKFFPSVCPLLQQVTVVSARTSFEHIFPDSPLKWKYYAMHSSLVGGGFFGIDGRASTDKHIISLGDSCVEREAIRALCKGVPSTRLKTVKLAERPSCEQLRRQLELLNQCFGYIATHAGDLDLQLTVTMNTDGTPASTAPHTASGSAESGVTAPLAAESKATLPAVATDADDALSTSEAKDVSPSHAHSKLEQEQQQCAARSCMVDV